MGPTYPLLVLLMLSPDELSTLPIFLTNNSSSMSVSTDKTIDVSHLVNVSMVSSKWHHSRSPITGHRIQVAKRAVNNVVSPNNMNNQQMRSGSSALHQGQTGGVCGRVGSRVQSNSQHKFRKIKKCLQQPWLYWTRNLVELGLIGLLVYKWKGVRELAYKNIEGYDFKGIIFTSRNNKPHTLTYSPVVWSVCIAVTLLIFLLALGYCWYKLKSRSCYEETRLCNRNNQINEHKTKLIRNPQSN